MVYQHVSICCLLILAIRITAGQIGKIFLSKGQLLMTSQVGEGVEPASDQKDGEGRHT